MSNVAEEITRHYRGNWTGKAGTFPTPGHGPKDRGMSVTNAPGAPDGVIINSFNGGDPLQVKDELRAAGILPQRGKARAIPAPGPYIYRDATGAPTFRVVRKTSPEKGFYQQHLDSTRQWIKGLNGTDPVPYRLPELIAAPADEPVYICEGEKDADALAARGLVATTNSGGAGKWRENFASYLIGRECVILQDNDEAGRKHTADVTRKLVAAGVDCVTLALPGLPDKGDVSDWLAAGGTAATLVLLAAKAWDSPAPLRQVKAAPTPLRKFGSLTAVELGAMKFDPLGYVVPGILPDGLALLAGKPKFGKSFMAMGLSIAVASGGLAFGSIQCEARNVLYCALEDSNRSLKSRLNKMLPYGGLPMRLHFETVAPRIDNGLVDMLETWLDDHPGPAFITLDVWRAVKPTANGRGSAYDDDANGIAPLLELTKRREGLCILVLHHIRKMEAEDPFDTISGTNGLSGVPDTLLVLAKHGDVSKLSARGREIEEYEKALGRDRMTGGWTMIGEASLIGKTSERQAVIDALRTADEPMTAREVSDLTDETYSNVRRRLTRMAAAGEIGKAGRGRYVYPCPNSPNVPNNPRCPDDWDIGTDGTGGPDND